MSDKTLKVWGGLALFFFLLGVILTDPSLEGARKVCAAVSWVILTALLTHIFFKDAVIKNSIRIGAMVLLTYLWVLLVMAGGDAIRKFLGDNLANVSAGIVQNSAEEVPKIKDAIVNMVETRDLRQFGSFDWFFLILLGGFGYSLCCLIIAVVKAKRAKKAREPVAAE